ncbi:pro-sigmaK processing inhibitor BofA family protein [Paenibacillus chartarius]|uniref:Pro-sigmaK processing inhibitor BofA family protein n=1 Tax=Paenibacillus chartarius TaxID=747481 RepID=A0ABV6DS28_9BACL
MKMIMWGVLGVSALLLIIVVLRSRAAGRWLTYLGVNIIVAAFLLYFVNLVSSYTQFTLPINVTTIATVGVLGVPGLMLLAALKLVLI